MRGILILNTGSPRTRNKKDVQWFIGAMLSDPLVVSTVPNWFRPILAKGIIAPLRASNSASHYAQIWDYEHDASPLIYNSQQLALKIEKETGMPVEVAMRYGYPEIPQALEKLEQKCPTLHEVVVVPMFPQYAESSYQTAVNAVGEHFYKRAYKFRLKILEPYFNNPAYISSLATSLRPYVERDYDRLIFSFHSLPLDHVERGWKKGKEFDYVYQIKETIRLITKELELDPKKNRIVYSSAIGKKWLRPFLDDTMETLPKEEQKNIIVITPGFPADNLETIYDIHISAREIFMKNGGVEFHAVTGLNSEDFWVEAVIRMVTSKI